MNGLDEENGCEFDDTAIVGFLQTIYSKLEEMDKKLDRIERLARSIESSQERT